MNFNKIKFRASGNGKLMTAPRTKGETLSETTKAYLVEVYIQLKYGRRPDIVNQFIQKGLMVEESAITLLSEITGAFIVKNEQHFSNDWVTGTPDIITPPLIRDIKSSWDIHTFFKSKMGTVNKDYYWQMQTYMDLTGCTEASLDYCLVNTPEVLIEGEKRKFMWNSGIVNPDDEISQDAYDAIEKACRFDDIPIAERLHSVKIERNQDDINRLHERIELCREWMSQNFK